MIPLSMMYAGIMVAVSAAARSMREAQSYLAVLNLVVMGPAVASQVVGVAGMDKSAWIAWVPVLGIGLAPLAQWVVVPVISLWIAARESR